MSAAEAPPTAVPPDVRSTPESSRFGAWDALLYAVTVFGWSTSWIAMKAQVVAQVAPEASLLWRFLIAATIMWGWVIAARLPTRFPLRTHVLFAAMGFFIFSMNFDLFYHGARDLPSGLLSVVFSLASVINLLMGRVIFGQRISTRVLVGGLLGFAGVGAMFWPRIQAAGLGPEAAGGLLLCVLGTSFFCTGNMLSSVAQKRGASVVAASAWGMTWGVVWLALPIAVGGVRLDFDPSVTYVASLLWLAVVSSVAAFWAYLTLLGRIGAARAGYSTVMFPVFALAISTIFEGYVWTAPAVIGLLMVLAGNLFVLKR